MGSRDLLATVLDHAPGFIIAVDADGKIQFINRVLPQYDRNEVIGEDWLTYMPPDQHESLRRWLDETLTTGKSHTYETCVPGPKGDKMWFTTQLGPMRNGDQVVGAVLVAQEITELRRTQLEFQAAQRMAAVGSLAAGIAHEINTPLQFVGDTLLFLQEGIGDLLRLMEALQSVWQVVSRERLSREALDALAAVARVDAETDLPFLRANIPSAFETCVDGLERVTRIVRSIREFAHPAQAEPSAADLNRAIETTLRLARSEYVNVAELETDLGELPRVICHVDQINQVVLNLVVNAAHAIADVVKDTGAKGHLAVKTRAEGDDVVISVADTGTGIPENVRDRIFEPFFTTKEVGKGTGQGLALAWKQVTEQHGGTLTFDTTPGHGTTFHVRLPVGHAQENEHVAIAC